MSKHMKKLMSLITLVFLATILTGCGGGSTSPKAATVETPLWCKAPETINSAGTACELVITPCNYPEVANAQGICTMSIGEWRPGANGIDMPAPVYTAGANEVVYYYTLKPAAAKTGTSNKTDPTLYKGWGLHAWNSADCDSYADFTHPDGGTDWTAPLQPTGIDPNYGAYWVLNLVASPTCTNFIPHNLDQGIQTVDLSASFISTTTNPTGSHNFFILEGHEDTIFPFPRTFNSLIVPGGATLICTAPLILNAAGDACIADPNAVTTFVPGDKILYLRGSMNAWAANDVYAFSYANNIYTMVASLPASANAYEFKIADTDWSASTSFGATAGEEDVVIGTGKTLTITDGQNIRIKVDADTNYQFTFDATNPDAPVLTIIPVAYNKVLYVRGGMNGWGSTLAMTYQGNNIYTAEYSLDAIDYEFKVADANWTNDTNFGAAAGDEVQTLDTPKTLVFGDGVAQNIKLSIASAGVYRFTLDATDLAAPILTVSNAIPYGSVDLFLKGSMNSWGSVAAGYKFSYANNHYTLTTVIAAGSQEFKISDPNWTDASTIGAVAGDGPIVIGEARTMTLPGANIKLDVATDTSYTFDLDATNKAAPILTITEQVIPYSGRDMFLKGSMNDWGNISAGYKFSYANSNYSLTVLIPAGSYDFKISDPTWADDSTIGAVTGDPALVVGEARTLTLPGDNLKLDVATDTMYNFNLNVIDPSAPILTITEAAPYGAAKMFLKGTMNNWGKISNGYQFSYANNHYTLKTTIVAGSHEFKISDPTWADASTVGSVTGDPALVMGEARTLTSPGDNILLDVATDAMYNFDLDATNKTAPILTVNLAAPYGAAEMFLKGTMNDWGKVSAGYKFSYANNHYTLVTTLLTGSHEFKIADPTWAAGSTIGAVTGDPALVVAEPRTMTLPGDNIKLDVAADTTYKLDIDATDNTAPILTVTEFAVPFVGRTLYLKGSMNGWSTVAGSDFSYVNGIFTLEATLDAGSYDFKIASDGWEDDSTLGGFPGNTTVTVDTPLTVATKINGGTDNLTIVVDVKTIYILTINAIDANAVTLTVTKKP